MFLFNAEMSVFLFKGRRGLYQDGGYTRHTSNILTTCLKPHPHLLGDSIEHFLDPDNLFVWRLTMKLFGSGLQGIINRHEYRNRHC